MCPLWAVLALGWLPLSLAVDLEPQLASITFATNNPTLTTVTLEKPFCMFNASNLQNVSYEVNLYVMVNSGQLSCGVQLLGGQSTENPGLDLQLGVGVISALPSCFDGQRSRCASAECCLHALGLHPPEAVSGSACLALPAPAEVMLPEVAAVHAEGADPNTNGDFPLGSCLSGSVRQAVVQDNRSFPINSTFQETAGGQRAPYKAASFLLPQCADLPDLNEAGDVSKAAEILQAYLVRVGDDGYCLLDPNFKGTCNPPLTRATAYRFKYVLVNTSSGFVEDQTLWSQPIRTNQSKCPRLGYPINCLSEISSVLSSLLSPLPVSPPSDIDLWPGRRSGAMIVITSILSTLVFFLLVGFAAAAIFSFASMGSSDLEMQHESQISQEAVPKAQGAQEPSYASVNRRQSLDRAEVYTSKLQD
ncbi:uroplakin-3a [Sarcophilus harrisii]